MLPIGFDSDLLFDLLFKLMRIFNNMGFNFTDPTLLPINMNCDNLMVGSKLLMGHVTPMPLPLKAHAFSHGERAGEFLRKIPELFGKFSVLSRG